MLNFRRQPEPHHAFFHDVDHDEKEQDRLREAG